MRAVCHCSDCGKSLVPELRHIHTIQLHIKRDHQILLQTTDPGDIHHLHVCIDKSNHAWRAALLQEEHQLSGEFKFSSNLNEFIKLINNSDSQSQPDDSGNLQDMEDQDWDDGILFLITIIVLNLTEQFNIGNWEDQISNEGILIDCCCHCERSNRPIYCR